MALVDVSAKGQTGHRNFQFPVSGKYDCMIQMETMVAADDSYDGGLVGTRPAVRLITSFNPDAPILFQA